MRERIGTSFRCSGSEARCLEKLAEVAGRSAGAVSFHQAGEVHEEDERSMARMNFVMTPHETPKMWSVGWRSEGCSLSWYSIAPSDKSDSKACCRIWLKRGVC